MRWFLILTLTIGRAGLATAETCDVCTWNVLRAGQSGHDAKKDWALLARVIADTGAEVFAFQEIMSPEGAFKLAAALQRVDANWTLALGEATGSSNYSERGLCMWRKNYVTLINDTSPVSYPDPQSKFAKDPYAIRLRSGAFDFVLISEHISFGEPKRQREVEALPDVVAWAQERWPEEKDILLVGDWNAPPTWAYWSPLRAVGFVPVNTTTLTTLGKSKPRSMLYDNLWYAPAATTAAEYAGEFLVPQIDQLYLGGDYKKAQRVLSDHLPLCVRFSTDSDDD